MRLYELLDSGVDIQSEYVICYYDYDQDVRVELEDPQEIDEVSHAHIRYMYCEDNVLYLELNTEDVLEKLGDY